MLSLIYRETAQISSLRSLSPETWAAIAAGVGAVAVAAKKLLSRKPSPKPDYVTRAEFHQEMLATRDRIDARHAQLLSALTRQSEVFETRLDHLEATLARLDERTKL